MSDTIQRAYSLLTVRSVNAEQRLISGLASTPEVDRMGDVVVPEGARFASELPLLLFHDTRLPVGRVRLAKTTTGQPREPWTVISACCGNYTEI